MAYIEGPKYTGTLLIDLTPNKDDLRDIPPKGLLGARGPGAKLPVVLNELSTAIPNHGEQAEIHPAIYQRVVEATAKIEQLRAKEIELMKLLEVVRESRCRLENNREEDVGAIGSQAEKKAVKAKMPELGAYFENTIEYKSRNADKSAETRARNEEEAKAKAEEEAKKAGQPPTP